MARNNILYIAPSVGIGGVETFLKHISQGHSSNCAPYFLLFQKGPLGQWLETQDAIVFYCHHRPRLSRPWTWLLFQLELYRIVKHNKINIVHANLSYSALFTWPCYFFCKFIWFQHGPVSGWMDRLSYALPHHAVIFNSEHTLQQQLVVNGNSNARATDYVLHLGTPAIDTDKRHFFKDQLLTKYQLPTNTMVVTMACRLQRWKGAHIAIQAVEKLSKSTDLPVVLFIHGDASWDNTYAEELKNMASELPIHICPPIDDLTSIYLATDIVLNCSTTPEPFGFTIIEALAASAIPIAARLGGPKEILSPYLEDCLFESENPDDLCRILLLFINDAKKMQIYKAKCFDLFENKFRLDTMVGNIESIYQKTLSS